MTEQVDVSQLAVRGRDSPRARIRVRRHVLSRYVLPALIVLAFVALVGWSARGMLLPAREVTVMPVVVKRATGQQAGEPLFAAAGWVEPRPAPVLATALAAGVIQRVPVVEDQAVESGQPIAHLIDTDARLALQDAKAARRVKEAKLESAKAQLDAARIRAEQPVELEVAVAEAESLLAEAQTALGNLPFEIRVAEVRARLAQQNLQHKIDAGKALPGRELERAQAELDQATAQAEQLRARQPRLENQVAALGRRRDALQKQLNLKTTQIRELKEAEAAVKAAEAALDQAALAESAAQLELERMTVRASVAGRVLEVVARPGTRVVAQPGDSGRLPGTVVTLYDPAMLQVRADVRLEDLPRVVPGQPVRIETAVVSGPFAGEVLFATSRADVQKNTLEVKLAVTDPPPLLRPEMLVQVTFLAPETAESESSSGEKLRIYVPTRLLGQDEDGTFVWVAGQGTVARRQPVKTGGRSGDLVEIIQGLTPASRLIVAGRDGLADGQRIKVTAEDDTLGTRPDR